MVPRFFSCYKFNSPMFFNDFFNIFDGFSKNCVIHQLKKKYFSKSFFADTLRSVLISIFGFS